MNVKILSITPDAEKLIERAGRVCYKTEMGDTANFLRNRIKEGHESILEHASVTFEIDDISRACSHQLVRHRIASPTQESQRYVDGSDFEYVVPESIYNSEAYFEYIKTMDFLKKKYVELRAYNIPKEDARFILPNACITHVVETMNFRTLRHFFKERLPKCAQWEIRELAEKMLDLVVEHAPTVFEDIKKCEVAK